MQLLGRPGNPASLPYALIQQMGWLDAGTVWHVVQNAAMWSPYCVLLPAWLRRHSGVAWTDSYWFKLNLYMVG